MIKLLFALFTAMVLFIASPFKASEDKLKITPQYPAVIKPGDSFTVTLHIHKGKISGTGKLQQYLPPGLSAKELHTSGADFAFEDQSVKFLWSSMPNEEDITVSYKITTESSISGLQVINGLFVYLDEDHTKREPIPQMEIKADINFIGDEKPVVTRKLISIAPEKGEYRVELKVKTNGVREWAQFSDGIPADFTPELIDAHQGEYSFANKHVVFKWDQLPDEPEFTVSYMVRSGKEGTPPSISGVLVFGNQNTGNSLAEEKPADNNAVNENISVEKPENNQSGEQSIKNAETDNPASLTDQTQAPEQGLSVSGTSEMTAMGNINDAEAGTKQGKLKSGELIKSYPDGMEKGKNPLLQRIAGLIYKVQIAATRRSSVKTTNWFNSKYHINTDVELTMQEGWKKYLIGNFEAYQDAKKYSYKTREKIPDAFVVAYENGTIVNIRDLKNRKSINP